MVTFYAVAWGVVRLDYLLYRMRGGVPREVVDDAFCLGVYMRCDRLTMDELRAVFSALPSSHP